MHSLLALLQSLLGAVTLSVMFPPTDAPQRENNEYHVAPSSSIRPSGHAVWSQRQPRHGCERQRVYELSGQLSAVGC